MIFTILANILRFGATVSSAWLLIVITAVQTFAVSQNTPMVQTDAQTVFLYQQIKESLVWNQHKLANPFTEVTLRLTVVAPEKRSKGKEFTYTGYYDGDGNGSQEGDVWRFRLLFDQPGLWKVTASFIDPRTKEKHFEAPAEQVFIYQVSSDVAQGSLNKGHVAADENHPTRLQFSDGETWIPFSIHSSSFLYASDSVAKNWIDQHHRLGVNSIAVAFSPSEIDQTQDSGLWPFLEKENPIFFWKQPHKRALAWPEKGAEGFDYTRFDITTWRQIEKNIEYAASKNIYISIWFGISGLNRQYKGFGPNKFVSDTELSKDQKRFVDYFLARLASYQHLWHWTVDSEYEEMGEGALARNRTYASYMLQANPWDTLTTTHVLYDWSPLHAPEFTLATLQRRVPEGSDLEIVQSTNQLVVENYGFNLPVYNSEGVWNLPEKEQTFIATLAHLMSGGYSNVAHDSESQLQSSWGVSWENVTVRHQQDARVLGDLATFFNSNPLVLRYFNAAVPDATIVFNKQEANYLGLHDTDRAYILWWLGSVPPIIQVPKGKYASSVTVYDLEQLNKEGESYSLGVSELVSKAKIALPLVEEGEKKSGRLGALYIVEFESAAEVLSGNAKQ